MSYDYDAIVIGLGPAGMAVSVMASEMGLKVCAIEKRAIGGECMNVGCIPSKALLRIAKTRNFTNKLDKMELTQVDVPEVKNPFTKIQKDIIYINEKKNAKMFDKVDLLLKEGDASFVDKHTVQVGEKKVTAKRIYIATGTKPAIPPIPGIDTIENVLTNENIFSLDEIPQSMTIIGGGAIGCEMAQAFTRLGTKCSIVHMDPHLLPTVDKLAADLLEVELKKENIDIFNSRMIQKLENIDGKVKLITDKNEEIVSDRLLVAAGRAMDFSSLKLENAGVDYTKKGITVKNNLRTSQSHIYAIGDCNGHFLLSHAAMHQGMIALMNSMMPFKKNFKNYVVPWTVFTEPQVSQVGILEKDLIAKGTKYFVVEAKYENYGAAIAENIAVGFVRVLTNKKGRIFGATIVGEGSGEMINEWALAVQKKINLNDILYLQHSFPTMSFLNKRIAENWMMKKMESKFMKTMSKFMFRM